MRLCAALLICVATPLAAQSDQVMTDAMCGALFPDPAALNTAEPVRVDADGWCSLRGISGAFSVDNLRVKMPAAEVYADTGLPPASLSLRLDGVTPAFDAQAPDADLYLNLFGALDQTFGATVDYRWDADTNQFFLTEAALREAGGNQFQLSAVLDQLDLSGLDAITSSVSETGLSDFTLRSKMDGTFNTAAVITTSALVVFGQLTQQSDEVLIKASLLRAIPDIPETTLAAEDAAALIAFVNAWPYPSGTFEMTVQSTRGLTFSRVIAVIPDGFEDAADLFGFFPDVTITAVWTPTP